ncbi:MAG TPA: cation diffusion facilitator family transporter [Burkholderiales bacterium]|nr:cation diffusion facilitator family transporter [Burkholderiales bacterium]
MSRTPLVRFAWLSIAAAVATIALKAAAWWLTGSVGLLSDALESFVNLAAAVVTLAMLGIAARPPDEEYAYGYSKAEYFASGFEGTLILVAAALIAMAAIERLLSPRPLQHVGIGLAISVAASAVNFGAARVLARAGRDYRSIALEADAQHLMTDVWTSVGVVAGVALVALTGWLWLDPVIALAVAAQIVWTGVGIVRRSVVGLLDRALPEAERRAIEAALDGFRAQGIEFHALRTRAAAGRSFVSMHVLVPGAWSIQRGHDIVEEIEARVRGAVPGATVFTHLEPLEDPASYGDERLDRERG